MCGLVVMIIMATRSLRLDLLLRILWWVKLYIIIMVVSINNSFIKKLPVGSTVRLKDMVLGALLLYSGGGLDGTAAISVSVDLSVVLLHKGGKLEMVEVDTSRLSSNYSLYTFQSVAAGELELVSMQ